jgi:hypothetical protein
LEFGACDLAFDGSPFIKKSPLASLLSRGDFFPNDIVKQGRQWL